MMRLRYCYERELRRSPTLRGKMRVVFQVDPSGQVSQCEISQIDFVKTPELVSCVEKTFLTMQFPGWTSGQPVTINYPLHFETRDGRPVVTRTSSKTQG